VELGIEFAKLDIVLGQFGLKAQPRSGQIGRACLGQRLIGGNLIAYPAPQIDLIAGRAAQRIILIFVMAARDGRHGARARGAGAGVNAGQQVGAGLTGQRAGLIKAGKGSIQSRAVMLDPLFQPVQHRIGQNAPPCSARHRIGGRGRGPQAGFLEGGRRRRGLRH
ncbi:hypothetical protein KXW36_000712, partial [Aspergillus fumigatus]